jgi:hypothetical protein
MVESERFCARPLSRSSESPDGREFLVGRAALRASCDLRKSHLLACLLGKAWEQAVALGHRRQAIDEGRAAMQELVATQPRFQVAPGFG